MPLSDDRTAIFWRRCGCDFNIGHFNAMGPARNTLVHRLGCLVVWLALLIPIGLAIGSTAAAPVISGVVRAIGKAAVASADDAARLAGKAGFEVLDDAIRAGAVPLNAEVRQLLGISLDDAAARFGKSLPEMTSGKGAVYWAMEDGVVIAKELGEAADGAVFAESDVLASLNGQPVQAVSTTFAEREIFLAVEGAPKKVFVAEHNGKAFLNCEVDAGLVASTTLWFEARGLLEQLAKRSFKSSDCHLLVAVDPSEHLAFLKILELEQLGLKVTVVDGGEAAMEEALKQVAKDIAIVVGHQELGAICTRPIAGLPVRVGSVARMNQIAQERGRHLVVLGCEAGTLPRTTGPIGEIGTDLLAERIRSAVSASDWKGFLSQLGTQRNPLVFDPTTLLGAGASSRQVFALTSNSAGPVLASTGGLVATSVLVNLRRDEARPTSDSAAAFAMLSVPALPLIALSKRVRTKLLAGLALCVCLVIVYSNDGWSGLADCGLALLGCLFTTAIGVTVLVWWFRKLGWELSLRRSNVGID